MFDATKVKKLNDVETVAINYILAHLDEVKGLTIRDLASKSFVSKSTILRMANKLGFDGFSELKFYMTSQNMPNLIEKSSYDGLSLFSLFLNTLTSIFYQEKLQQAAEQIKEASSLIFMGIGTSGTLAEYGVKYFRNLGIKAYAIEDIYQPLVIDGGERPVFLILSVTGGRVPLIDAVMKIKQQKVPIISITNDSESTLTQLSDISLCYDLPNELSLTQLPVVALLENLAHLTKALKTDLLQN